MCPIVELPGLKGLIPGVIGTSLVYVAVFACFVSCLFITAGCKSQGLIKIKISEVFLSLVITGASFLFRQPVLY